MSQEEREVIISSDQMERRLLEAARKGNIHELNDLIGSNEQILEEMTLEGAGHTPLHVACMGGHLDFVREVLKHMPKLAEKVDPRGYSPLHIAAARGDVEIARELLKVGTHLCSVKGRERRIPLHYAVENGEVSVMKELLSTLPESVEETTTQEETVFHLAVKNNRFDAFVVLVDHLKQHKKEHVINWKDNKGNTVLHLAVGGKNIEVVDFMLCGHAMKSEDVKVNALNENGLTPLDVLNLSPRGTRDREIKEILARAGALHGGGRSNPSTSKPVSASDDDIEGGNGHQSDGEPVPNAPQTLSHSTSKKSNKDGGESTAETRNALLVVAALIASATYQSMLQPPSIIEVDKVNKFNNTSLKSGKNTPPKSSNNTSIEHDTITYGAGLVYTLFLGGNTFGFLVSVQTIICLTKELPVRMPLVLSLIAMVQTYFCFTLSVMITSIDGPAAMLHLTPIMISIFLLLIQWWLAKVTKHLLRWLSRSQYTIFGNMYNLKAKNQSPDEVELRQASF